MNTIIKHRIADRKQRSEARLDKFNFPHDLARPMLRSTNVRFDLAGRATGTAYGGLGLVHQLVRPLGLAAAIDERLHLFKVHLPNHESDHVLNLAYSALCDGRCLEDLELRRQDEAYLNLLGADSRPDHGRRFLSPLPGARLALTLANTGEVLRLVNRSGNRPVTKAPRPCSMSALNCAARLASEPSCSAAIPTSRKPSTSTAGTSKATCGSSSGWMSRQGGTSTPTI